MTEDVPFLVSWNITKRCNLKCDHCYLDAAELEGTDDLSTDDCFHIVDEIASLNPQSMLILTGGEPLLRTDLTDISRYAVEKGMMVVLGTNGTLVDAEAVRRLKEGRFSGVGISLDSVSPAFHDRFRGMEGAWEKTVRGMEELRKAKIDFQVQLTVTKENHTEIPALVEFAHEKGARALNVFFLVCTGRGQEVTDITPADYEEVLKYLVKAESEYEGRIMVRARCAPHILRVASEMDPESPLLKGFTSGCIAATGYYRISPEGRVSPCPYMPAGPGTPSALEKPMKEIWEETEVFKRLRHRTYDGKCGDCEYSDVCGGCRARALATSGNDMGEDPWCDYEPKGKKAAGSAASAAPIWTSEATTRLEKVPRFLRTMVRKGVERYAKSKGLTEITADVMAELNRRRTEGK